ncbi:MAG: hypothetical protein ABL951_03140 [Alphaproteobacteria bacterium]
MAATTGMKFFDHRTPITLFAACVTATFLLSNAQATLIRQSSAAAFEIKEFSFKAVRDIFYTPASNFSFDENTGAIDPAILLPPPVTMEADRAGSPHSGAIKTGNLVLDNGDLDQRATNRDLETEIARHSKNNAVQAINETELVRLSASNELLDQYVHTTVTTYMQDSGIDINAAHRSAAQISASISNAMTGLYVPEQLLDRNNSGTNRAAIYIAPFEQTLPGMIYAWFSNPVNYGTTFVLLAIVLVVFVGLNLFMRSLARYARRNTR